MLQKFAKWNGLRSFKMTILKHIETAASQDKMLAVSASRDYSVVGTRGLICLYFIHGGNFELVIFYLWWYFIYDILFKAIVLIGSTRQPPLRYAGSIHTCPAFHSMRVFIC